MTVKDTKEITKMKSDLTVLRNETLTCQNKTKKGGVEKFDCQAVNWDASAFSSNH